MKHISLSLLLVVLFLFSCERYQFRKTDNHHIVNKTDKELVHVLYSNHVLIEQDSFVCHVHGKCDTTLEGTVSAITSVKRDTIGFSYGGFCVFNLTDTTSLYWKDSFGGYEYHTELIPKLFNCGNYKRIRDSNKRETNRIVNYYLTVDDTFINKMKKDSSMLERFSEYYRR